MNSQMALPRAFFVIEGVSARATQSSDKVTIRNLYITGTHTSSKMAMVWPKAVPEALNALTSWTSTWVLLEFIYTENGLWVLDRSSVLSLELFPPQTAECILHKCFVSIPNTIIFTKHARKPCKRHQNGWINRKQCIYSRDELFQRSLECHFLCLSPELRSNKGNKHQNNTRVSVETVRHESTYIISFLTHHNESINDDKDDDFYTSSPCLICSVFVLLMTS